MYASINHENVTGFCQVHTALTVCNFIFFLRPREINIALVLYSFFIIAFVYLRLSGVALAGFFTNDYINYTFIHNSQNYLCRNPVEIAYQRKKAVLFQTWGASIVKTINFLPNAKPNVFHGNPVLTFLRCFDDFMLN